MTTKQQKMEYKKYTVTNEVLGNDEFFIYDAKRNLVGGADSLRQAKHIINKMREQNVRHENDIVWPIRKIVKK